MFYNTEAKTIKLFTLVIDKISLFHPSLTFSVTWPRVKYY